MNITLQKVALLVGLVLCINACSGTSALSSAPSSKPVNNKSIPSFNPHINPYDRKDYSRHSDYENNPFVEFYESEFLAPSLQECYKNAPELFLASSEEPMIISVQQLDNFFKMYGALDIGISTYNGNFYGEQQDALELARVLRAKFVVWEAELIDEYGTVEGQKVQRKSMYATFAIGDGTVEKTRQLLQQKCPLLFQEFQMRQQQNQ